MTGSYRNIVSNIHLVSSLEGEFPNTNDSYPPWLTVSSTSHTPSTSMMWAPSWHPGRISQMSVLEMIRLLFIHYYSFMYWDTVPGSRNVKISNRISQFSMLTVVSKEQIDLLWQSVQVSYPVSILLSSTRIQPLFRCQKTSFFSIHVTKFQAKEEVR